MTSLLILTQSVLPIPQVLKINYNAPTLRIRRGHTWYILRNWDRHIPQFLHYIGVLPDAGLVSVTVDGHNGMIQFDRGIDAPDQHYALDFTTH